MPSLAASRITSTGKCFSSSQRTACGAIFSAANSRAISRTATWSSLRAKCIGLSISHDLFRKAGSHLALTRPSGSGSCELVHGRNRELRPLLAAGRPARGDGLGLGVEANRIRAVLVEVAETGLLPAAEGVGRDRHRDRHVDADHADIDLGGEIARGAAVAGEDRSPIAVIM